MQGLRRDRNTVAGRVLGAHGDYWVRLELALPIVSACDCGRPRCRHAAAIIQAYHAHRLPVTDVGRILDEFLAHPRRAPLAAAALGEDLVDAMQLPPLDTEDIWALEGERRLLALDAALRLSLDPDPLLARALPEARHDPALSTLLAGAMSARPPAAADWPLLLRKAPAVLTPLLADLRPEDLSNAGIMAALWQAAAEGDQEGLVRLAPHAIAISPGDAYPALASLAGRFPELLPSVLQAARAAGCLARAAVRLARASDRAPEDEAARIDRVLLRAEDLPQRLKVLLRLRTAAAAEGAAQILAARRAALAAGTWQSLRPAVLRRIRQRADGAVLETQLLLAEGDLEAAAHAAAHCRSSPLPERLLAEALRASDPAAARRHELRAQAIAAQLTPPAKPPKGRFSAARRRNPKTGR